MGFINNIFGKKEATIKTYDDFWAWFRLNEKAFFKTLSTNGDIEAGFLEKVMLKLKQLNEGFYMVAGMFNDATAELIITAEGSVKNIAFVEELVSRSPQIEGWRFTALKPALRIEDVNIQLGGLKFNSGNLSFYSNELSQYPDEIDITVIHQDFNKANEKQLGTGTYIFLDNYLGELEFATIIDNLTVKGPHDAEKELVPISKLKDFLIWRQKEFIEKYEGTRHNTENDNYGVLKAELENGHPLFAIINTELLNWESKASHPWVLTVEIKYDGGNNNGMPDNDTYELLSKIENNILEELKDHDGYLNIGRQTAESVREIYFACKDFRKPTLVIQKVVTDYHKRLEISYTIYKDKYWRTFDKFRQ